MDKLKSVFGAVAVAVNIAGGAYGQSLDERSEPNMGYSNGFMRVQLHDLPSLVLPPILYSDPLDIPRNPANLVGGALQTVDSIGPVDSRRMVTHGDEDFDFVVAMTNMNGFAYCTANIVNVEGYQTREKGTLIATAAHCLKIRNAEGVVIGQRQPEDIFFKGSYISSEGKYQEFTLRGDKLWQNPLYHENDMADKDYLKTHGYLPDLHAESDTALIFTHQLLPDEVEPAGLLPMDYQMIGQIAQSVMEEKNTSPTSSKDLLVAGFSGDKPYLTVDESAIVSVDDDGIRTDADIAPGASGGPVIFSYEIDSTKQSMVIGVNSTVDLVYKDNARHAIFREEELSTVPFLRANEDWGQDCRSSAEVTASALNIRVSPDQSAQKLAPLDGQTSSEIERGGSLVVHGLTHNSLQEQWALVTTELGRTGYVNASYITKPDTICASAPTP